MNLIQEQYSVLSILYFILNRLKMLAHDFLTLHNCLFDLKVLENKILHKHERLLSTNFNLNVFINIDSEGVNL
jgi:hypothetical protein